MLWSFQAEDVATASAARREFVAFLRAENVLDDDRVRAEMVFGELLANVVRHAPGPVSITLRGKRDVAELVVSDAGPGFDLALVLADDDAESKRGLYITKALVHTLIVQRSAQGTQITAVFALRRETPSHFTVARGAVRHIVARFARSPEPVRTDG